MAHTSTVLNLYNDQTEQNFYDDLIVESIELMGDDFYYLPRVMRNEDQLYGTDDSSVYEKAYPIPMYVKTVDNFAGFRDAMSKLTGHTINDQLRLGVSRTTFERSIGVRTGMTRPREGDVVYFPMAQKVFVVRFVDKFDMFYQLGKIYTYDLTVELFEYSNERFSTGIPEIDAISSRFTSNVIDRAITDEEGNYLTTTEGEYVTYEPVRIANPLADNDFLRLNVDDIVATPDEADEFEFGKVGS